MSTIQSIPRPIHSWNVLSGNSKYRPPSLLFFLLLSLLCLPIEQAGAQSASIKNVSQQRVEKAPVPIPIPPVDKNICKYLKVNVNKVAMGYCCCFEISLLNNYKGSSKNIPYGFGVSLANTTIVSSFGLTSGWYQNPTNVPPETHTLTWSKKGAIPYGNTKLAVICMKDDMGPSWLVYEWKNMAGRVICKDSIKIGCKETQPGCCAYSLHFVNKLTNTTQYSKIKVTAIGATKINNADPGDWTQVLHLPYSVEWSFPNGNIPNGEAIDNDIIVYLQQAANQSLKIDWLDLNGNVACTHMINIPCSKLPEDEDWTKYTSTTPINDPKLFVFAVPEENEEDCGYDEDYKLSSCDFTTEISCDDNKYKVTVTGPSDFDSYSWTVADANQNVTNTFSGQYNSFELITGGGYIITLNASNSAGDPCFVSQGITIPSINPDFSWNQHIGCRIVDFYASGAADPHDVSAYLWLCYNSNGDIVSGLPHVGQFITFDFPADDIYTVELTIVDIYGCKHVFKKEIKVSMECQPDFHIQYIFYPNNCDSMNVNVTFVNDSKGGYNPITFTWNFGDGSLSSEVSPIHSYRVDCNKGNNFFVTLNMNDATQCNKTIQKTIEVKPCIVNFTYDVCPDGRVNFEANHYGTWTFPGSHSVAPWPYSGLPKIVNFNVLYKKLVVRYDHTGDYTVTFEGYCEPGGKCTKQQVIHIELDCCAKNDAVRKYHPFSAANGKAYRMKYKFVQRQFPPYHRINGKTKLQIWKKISLWGNYISYWKGARADEIEASFTGKIYKRDGNAITGCNCKIELPISDSDIRISSTKAKFSKSTNGGYRSRVNTLQSTHRVKIGSTVIIKNLQLGIDCDPFRWWTDWY